MLGPELFQVLLQPVCREPAHFHTATAGDSAGREMEVQLRSGSFGIFTIQFKEIAHLIQQKATRIVCFGFKVRLIELRQSSILWLFSFCCLLDTLHNALRQVLHIEGDLTFGGDMGNVLIVPIDLHGTIPNGQSVAEIAHPDVELDRLFFRTVY